MSFIAAVQTNAAGHPLLACLTKLEFTKEAIAKWANKSLCASAQVVSDGLWCFKAVAACGATHERTVTGGGAASAKLEKFLTVNTLLGNLKTAFAGTYHSFDFAKYAHRYLAEVQYRFNRRFDLATILGRLLHASAATKPNPERRIRAAELGGQSGGAIAAAHACVDTRAGAPAQKCGHGVLCVPRRPHQRPRNCRRSDFTSRTCGGAHCAGAVKRMR